MSARRAHDDRYRGWRFRRITVTCRCGWVSMHHRSRGEARRAWEGHEFVASTGWPTPTFGVNAHRREAS